MKDEKVSEGERSRSERDGSVRGSERVGEWYLTSSFSFLLYYQLLIYFFPLFPQQLQELNTKFPNLQVVVEAADVSDYAQLQKAISNIRSTLNNSM
jgi:hypothetical protein